MIRFACLLCLSLLTFGCSGSFDTPATPTSTLDPALTAHSEPPYGEYHTLGHAGTQWTGNIPENPCNAIWGGSGHLHLFSIEHFDPWTEEFEGWTCEGGMAHIDGSTVGILD